VVLRDVLFGTAIVGAIVSQIIPALAGAHPAQQPAAASQQATSPPTPDQQEQAEKALPPGDGRKELIQVCTGCHLLTVISSQHKSESEWTDSVIEMRNRGANGSDDDMEKIVEYLAKNFGPQNAPGKININAAPASEIASALKLPEGQAQAIVDYREKNGNFNDLVALKKVRGVDTDKLEAAKDRIEY
jgi:competence ComEA-like helix-hairpin-helix protein